MVVVKMYGLTMLMVRRLDQLVVLYCMVCLAGDVVWSFPLVLTIVVSGSHVVVSDHTFLVMLMFVILIGCVVVDDRRQQSVGVDLVTESVIARRRFLPAGDVPSFRCIL